MRVTTVSCLFARALAVLGTLGACTTLELPAGPFSVAGGGAGGAPAAGGGGAIGGAGQTGGGGAEPLPTKTLVTDAATGLAGLAVGPQHIYWLEADAGVHRMVRGVPSSAELWQTGNGPVASASQLLHRGDRLFWLRRPDDGDCDAVVEEVTFGGLSFDHAFTDCFSGAQVTVDDQRIFAALDTAMPERLREATVGGATSFGESVVSLAIAAPGAAHADAQGGVVVSGTVSDCVDCTFRFEPASAGVLTPDLRSSAIASSATEVFLARDAQLWRRPYASAAAELVAELDGTVVDLELSPSGALYAATIAGEVGAVVRVRADGGVALVAEDLAEPRYLVADDAGLFIGDAARATIWRVETE